MKINISIEINDSNNFKIEPGVVIPVSNPKLIHDVINDFICKFTDQNKDILISSEVSIIYD